jgi:hypothetical protein
MKQLLRISYDLYDIGLTDQITLKGNVTIKGNVAIAGGSGGGAQAVDFRINNGKKFCMTCFLKEMGIKV